MRTHTWSILILLLAPAIGANAQSIHLSVNGVSVATSKADVVKKIGKPLSEGPGGAIPCEDKPGRVLRYNGARFWYQPGKAPNGFGVYKYEVTSSRWNIEGLKITATRKAVVKRLGDGFAKSSSISYGADDGEAQFFFRRGRLVKLIWEMNFC